MPMKPEIKICGMKSKEEIEGINRFDIQYAGFIFAKNSKRYIPPEQAAQLRRLLRPGIRAVGVFADTPIEEVNRIARLTGLDLIQLHSGETNGDCLRACRPVWKTTPVQDADSIGRTADYPAAAGILLDTKHQGACGGTGRQFDWTLARGLSERLFLILAGGLSPENIVEAAEVVRPHVLDVNSGVETNGKKDEKKIERLVGRLKNELR